jgi:hypothetical protein
MTTSNYQVFFKKKNHLENFRGFGRFRFQVPIFGQIFENHGYISKPIIGFLNAWLCICENLQLLGAPFFFLITIKC